MEKKYYWTIELSNANVPGINTVRVYIENPPYGMVDNIEKLLKEYGVKNE